MSLSAPTKFPTPFCSTGSKNMIPATAGGIAQPYNASLDVGFPPITAQPIASGGLPPDQKDFNGILYELTQAVQYQQAGGNFAYDSAFAIAISGYPLGAIVQATDGSGFWINGTSGNTNDPEAFGTGWTPLAQSGASSVAMTSANVTLTALQAGKTIITISGTLTTSLNLVFPVWKNEWLIINNAVMGSNTITAETAGGSGVNLASGANNIFGDGANILTNQGNGFGVGQTISNPSRSINTVYQNTGLKMRLICVSVAGASSTQLAILVGPTPTPGITWGYSYISTTSGNEASVTAPVPVGWYYEAVVTGATLSNWAELQ